MVVYENIKLIIIGILYNFQSLLYIDDTVLQDLIPLLQDLLTTNIGLPTKVATSHFISLLITQKQLQLNAKFLGIVLKFISKIHINNVFIYF